MSTKTFGQLQFEILRKYLTTVIRASTTKLPENTNTSATSRGAILFFESENGTVKHAMVGKIVHNYAQRLEEAQRKAFFMKLHPSEVRGSNIQDLVEITHEGAIRVPGIGVFSLAGLPEGMNEICLLCGLRMDLLVDDAFVAQALRGDTELYERTFRTVCDTVLS